MSFLASPEENQFKCYGITSVRTRPKRPTGYGDRCPNKFIEKESSKEPEYRRVLEQLQKNKTKIDWKLITLMVIAIIAGAVISNKLLSFLLGK